MTYRWREHVGPNEDYHLGYRTPDEAEPWIAERPGEAAGRPDRPRGSGHASRTKWKRRIAAAFAFAEESPLPAPAELYTDVFKEG